MRISKILLAAGILSIAIAGGARADVINGTLAFGPNGANGGQFWSPSTINSPGQFFYTDFSNTDTATFSGTTLTIQDQVGDGANGFEMTFTDATTPFTNLSLISDNFSPGTTSSLSNGIITVDWEGTSNSGTTYDAVFNISSGVPEASTWAMMLIGFGGFGLLAYGKARKSHASQTIAI